MNYLDSLNEITFNLVIEQPFYGLFLAEINKKFVEKEIPTACVSRRPDSVNVELLINKDFWTNFLKTDSQRKYILMHECLHVIYNHFLFRDVRTDHLIDNIACDMEINQYCDQSYERPSDGIYIENFKELKLKTFGGTQYYYDELKKAQAKKDGSKGKKDSLNGEPGNKNGSSGCKSLDQILDNQPGDWHSEWEKISEGMNEAEKSLLEKQIHNAIKEAVEQIEKQRGDIPSHLKDFIKNAFEVKTPTVSWKSVLRQFMGSSMAYEPYRTRKRPNLRFEDTPVIKKQPKVRILFMPDQSGSMGEKELRECNNELYHIWKSGALIHVAEWDCEVAKPWEYKGKLEYQRVKSGGTQMSCATTFATENRKDYDLAVIISDGWVESKVKDCALPTLILITSDGNLGFETKHRKIKMNS